MDRTTIIVLVVCLGLFLLWGQVVNKLYPPKPLPPGATNAPSAFTSTNQPSAPSPAATPLTSPRLVVNTNVAEELLVVTNHNSRYTFTSHGGGLKLIELLEFTATTPRVRWESTKTNPVVLN